MSVKLRVLGKTGKTGDEKRLEEKRKRETNRSARPVRDAFPLGLHFRTAAGGEIQLITSFDTQARLSEGDSRLQG